MGTVRKCKRFQIFGRLDQEILHFGNEIGLSRIGKLMRLVVGEFLAQLFIEAIIVSPRGDEIGRRITQYGDFLNFGVIYTNTTTATIYSYSYYFYVFY